MGSKLSLLDVQLRSEQVDVSSDQTIEVYGICAEDIGKLLARFPNAFQQMVQATTNPAEMNPHFLCALIAASQRNGSDTSMLGNEACEMAGRQHGLGTQLKIVRAIGR